MNKEIDILKISSYDNFKCTADKCRFTCCEGWDVSIDTNTFNVWKNKKLDNISKNVKTKKCGSKTEYFINKKNHEACPLLDKQGLCEIVKSHGEGYLSLTCHMFPRIENIFEDRKELSLSCACPEVVELISKMNGQINIMSEGDLALESNLLELKIREAMISIVQKEGILFDHKMIICFQMLLSTLRNENFREDILLEELEKYKNKDCIKELTDMYEKIDLNINDSIEEINNLFLDIVQDYKEVSVLESILKDISEFAEKSEIRNLALKWHDYKNLFEQHNWLMENCIVSKIIGGCISSDIEELTISFQMIILEYLLIRYAVFLKYCMNKSEEINMDDIKDYIVVFSRVIGNNTEAVIEFIEDGFGDTVLEIGYLCFIALF